MYNLLNRLNYKFSDDVIYKYVSYMYDLELLETLNLYHKLLKARQQSNYIKNKHKHTIMYKQFDTIKDTEIDPNEEYYMTESLKSKGFTTLMMLSLKGKTNAITNHFTTLRNLKDPQLIKYIVNQKNESGWTPLMLACTNISTCSNMETIKLLLNNGADVNLQNNDGNTVLHLCMNLVDNQSSIKFIELLINNKADVNLRNGSDWTPLMFACGYSTDDDKFDTVKLLIDSGADVNIMNGHGIAFNYAYHAHGKQGNNTKILKLLLSNKMDAELAITKDITANDIVKVLL